MTFRLWRCLTCYPNDLILANEFSVYLYLSPSAYLPLLILSRYPQISKFIHHPKSRFSPYLLLPRVKVDLKIGNVTFIKGLWATFWAPVTGLWKVIIKFQPHVQRSLSGRKSTYFEHILGFPWIEWAEREFWSKCIGMCRLAKDRGRINSSAGPCLTLRCTQTPLHFSAGLHHSLMQGQLCRGGYWEPEWPLDTPGWVVWACAPCASPTPALAPPCPSRLVAAVEGHGASGRPSGPDSVCCQPCLAITTSLLLPLPSWDRLGAWFTLGALMPGAKMLPGDTQRCPLLGHPSFPEWVSSDPSQQQRRMAGHCNTGSSSNEKFQTGT